MSKFTKYFGTTVSVFLSLLCVVAIGSLQKPFLDREKQLTDTDFQRQEILKASKLELVSRSPSLGFQNLIASWLFLNFIQYYGDGEARNITGYRYLPDYYKSIVKRNPRFVQAYFLLDPAVTLFAGRPDISRELMEYGLQYISPQQSQAYQVWLFKATNELLFLGETQEAKKSFETAAEWATIENTEQSLAFSKIYSRTAQFLADNPDSKKAKASSWLMILNNAREDKVRKIALDNLKKLGAEVKIEGNRVSVSIPDDFQD